MQILKFALLSSAMLSLVGCGDSNCKITFSGENCFIRNEAGEEFTTLNVSKNSAVNLQIFIKEEAKYLVPDSSRVTITEGVEYNYYQSATTDGKHKAGDLIISNIDRDITITATARNRSAVTYSVEYPHDPNANWNGPTEVNSGDQLDATIEITKETYFITKSDINVRIGNNYFYDDFTFIDNKLTIPAGAINGKVVITGLSHRPGATYDVAFNVSNAEKDAEFPTVVKEGADLTATFTAKKGYRLPRIIDGNPQHDEFKIYKRGSGVNVALTPFDPDTWIGDFTYRITVKDGIEHGEVYIFRGVLVNSDFNTVSFEGDAVEQVTVTFQVGEGHWQNAVDSKEDRYGTVDKGDKLENALKDASGGEEIETPTIDTEGWHFDEWKDENENVINSQDPINSSLTVHATYEQIEYKVYTSFTNVTISGLPTDPIHWHDPLGGGVKPITLTAAEDYSLPSMDKVKVTMDTYDPEVGWVNINFNYTRSADNKTATFSIDSGIIEGDIRIEVAAIQFVSVTFDPGEGTWKNTSKPGPQTATVPVGSTFGLAFDSLNLGGEPTPPGAKRFSGWDCEGTGISFTDVIQESGKTVTAQYTEFITFQNDSWANVIAHANADDLKTTYDYTIYIGAERTLTYTDPITNAQTTYTVRVIDSDYDWYYKNGEMTLTALTFEFVDLVGQGRYGKNIPDKPYGRNTWKDSIYRSYLDTFYKQIKKDNEGFEVKPTIKYTLHGYVDPDDPDKEELDPRQKFETTENLFPLSGAEIGLADTSNEPTTTEYPKTQRLNEALPDGATNVWIYDYYKNGSTNSRVKKMPGADDGSDYWLRSPKIYSESETEKIIDSNCYCIKASGGTNKDYGGRSQLADYSKGYMAAFCI